MSFYSAAVVANPDLAWREALQALRRAGGGSSLLLGFGPAPVFVPEGALQAHTYIVGPSNSGKTSRVLAPVLTQLIAAHHPVWVVDCKPDPMLWGHMREAALAAGRKPHFFSLQPGIPSDFSLDFFEALRLAKRSPRQIAELLIGSLGLNKAAEPYFVTQNASALRIALERATAKGRVSFKAIAHELRGLVADKRFEHAGHALDVFEGLADVPELNPPKNGSPGAPALDFIRLMQEGGVCYFCLPVTTELKLTSATAASLLLKLTVAVSKDLAIQGTRAKRIYFAIDEFQDVAAASDLKDLIGQVRGVGAGISLILSHQVQEQVEDEGLRALLRSSGVLVLLSPRPLAKELQEWSGEKTVWLRGEGMSSSHGGSSQGGSWQESTSVNYTETIRPAIDLDLIQQVNALPGFGFVVIDGGVPTPLFFPHHVTKREAEARAAHAFAQTVPAMRPAVTVAPAPTAKGAPSTRAKPLPAQAPPAEDPLSMRLQKLFVRLRPTVLISAARRPK